MFRIINFVAQLSDCWLTVQIAKDVVRGDNGRKLIAVEEVGTMGGVMKRLFSLLLCRFNLSSFINSCNFDGN